MHLIQDAWLSLKNNQGTLFAYLVFSFCITFVLVLANEVISQGIDKGNPAGWVPAYETAMYLLEAALWGAMQAVIFARLGKQIDRPLWRSANDLDALRRFFMLWFILNLLFVCTHAILSYAVRASNDELVWFLLFVLMLLTMVLLPAGACVMYYGRLVWQELDRALQPLLGQLHLVIFVFAVLFAQYIANFLGQGSYRPPDKALFEPALYIALLTVPLAFLECLAFAMMWRICMIHRDVRHEETDPYDF